MAPSIRAIRTFLLTASIVTITIGGSLYGAELKNKQDVRQAAEKNAQASVDERIESLQNMRANLVSKKLAVERQLHNLEERIKEKRRKGLGNGLIARPNNDGDEQSKG